MPVVIGDSTPPFVEVFHAGFPVVEGYFWSFVRHSFREGATYPLISRANGAEVGYIASGNGYYDRRYRVTVGELSFAYETPSGAAHRLVVMLGLASGEEASCWHCGELRVDTREASWRSNVRRGGATKIRVCSECYSARGYRPCGICEEDSTPLVSTVSNGRICGPCMHREQFEECSMGCGTFHHPDEPQCCEHRDRCATCSATGDHVAEYDFSNGSTLFMCSLHIRSYRECSECDRYDYREDMSSVSGRDGQYCEGCVRDMGLQRCSCGNFYDPDDDEPCCDDAGLSLIRSYSYRPYPIFHGEGKTFLGLEVEIKTPRKGKLATQATRGFGDLAILKHDGSISNGFEIVTHPMSYEWAKDHFPWQVFTDLAKSGAYADDDCGIHVHVSKAGFASTAHDHRWYLFVHRNADQIQSIARRTASRWAAFDPNDRANAKAIAEKKSRGNGRYAAINVENEATYEMRVFASSLDVAQIQAAIGLVSASVEYTRRLTSQKIIRHNGWAWSSFAEWVSEHEEYAPLYMEMSRLDIAA